MCKIISHAYKAIVLLTLILLFYILSLTVFLRTPSIINYPSFTILLGSLLILLFILTIFHLVKNICGKNNIIFFVLLAISVIVPRFIWILLVDTEPASDFGLYYEYAVNASKGIFNIYDKTCIVFPHRLGFPLILSMLFRISGSSLITAKSLNILLSLAAALLLYRAGKEFFGERAGQTAAFLFAFYPSQIMYNSVIASEHMFIVFFLIAILTFILAQKYTKFYNRIILYLSCAFSISVAQFIRPLAVMLIPVFLFYILFEELSKNSIFKALIRGFKDISIISVLYLVFFGTFCIASYQLTGINMFKSSSGYSILVGTNYKYNGIYNNDDANILGEFNWNFDTVHKEAEKRTVNRIKSNPIDFLRLIEKKYTIFWGDDTYGSSFSLTDINRETGPVRFLRMHKKLPISLSQSYYIIIILFSFIGSVFLLKEKNWLSVIILLVFLMHVIAYTFLEIQPRYHYPAAALLIIISSFGLLKCAGIIHEYISERHSLSRHDMP